jgi:hypothetical protein
VSGAHATPDQLREFVKARIAAYKYPRPADRDVRHDRNA